MSEPDSLLAQRRAVIWAWSRTLRFTPAVACFMLGLLGAVPLVFLTPPFEVPDEQQHFYRSYQLSELRLWGSVRGNGAGAELPSSLPELAETFLRSRELYIFPSQPHPDPLSETWKALGRKLEPDRREFVVFTGAAFYSPLAYVPQATAMAIGRSLGAGPLELLYLARFINAVTTISLVALAIRILPFAGEAALFSALLPMALYLYASVSPDALVIASAFLFTSIALRGLLKTHWSPRDLVSACLTGAIFCSLKPVYVPLLMIGLPAALRRKRTRHVLLVHALIFVFAIGVTLAWFGSTARMPVPVPFASSVSPSTQADFIATNPLGFLKTLARTLLSKWSLYLSGIVGRLSWWQIVLPTHIYYLSIATMLFCLTGRSDRDRVLSRLEIAWNVLLISASAILVELALYLAVSPVGSPFVEGVWGRYFVPLLVLFAATAYSLLRMPNSWQRRASAVRYPVVLAVIVVNIIATDTTLARVYDLFGRPQ